jgi:hypothetical protein
MNNALVKPTALKWAKGLAIFQLVVGVLVMIFIYWVFFGNAEGAFFEGVRNGFAQELGKDSFYMSTAEGAGFIFGLFALGLLCPILVLVAIARQSKPWSIAALVLNGLSLGASLSLFTIAIMVCMLLPDSRVYLGLGAKK